MNIIICNKNINAGERWAAILAADGFLVSNKNSTDELLSSIGDKVLAIINSQCADTLIVKYLIKNHSSCRILILSDKPNDDEGVSYLKAGVAGYANSYIPPKSLLQAVNVILSGGVWVGQGLMLHIISSSFNVTRDEQSENQEIVLNDLTQREREITNLLVQGLSNKKIADRLQITERTVKAHLNSIYHKTGIHGRLPLALFLHGK